MTRYQRDVDPPHSAPLRYIRDSMSALGYAHLLAIGSLDGLVEASRQSKVGCQLCLIANIASLFGAWTRCSAADRFGCFAVVC